MRSLKKVRNCVNTFKIVTDCQNVLRSISWNYLYLIFQYKFNNNRRKLRSAATIDYFKWSPFCASKVTKREKTSLNFRHRTCSLWKQKRKRDGTGTKHGLRKGNVGGRGYGVLEYVGVFPGIFNWYFPGGSFEGRSIFFQCGGESWRSNFSEFRSGYFPKIRPRCWSRFVLLSLDLDLIFLTLNLDLDLFFKVQI